MPIAPGCNQSAIANPGDGASNKASLFMTAGMQWQVHFSLLSLEAGLSATGIIINPTGVGVPRPTAYGGCGVCWDSSLHGNIVFVCHWVTLKAKHQGEQQPG